MSKVTLLSEKLVFKGELFEVSKVEISYARGKKRIHHIAKRRPTVSVFPVTETFEIYLVSQYRYLLGKTTLEAVAGFIDTGEVALAAAKRELSEETGIKALHWEEVSRIELATSVFRAPAHLFLARDLELSDAKPEEGENVSLVKLPLLEAVEKVLYGQINSSATMIGILLLDRLRKQKKL